MKKLILPTFIVTALLLVASYTTAIHAQSPNVSNGSPSLTPTPTTVKSDFAIDLEEGVKATTNDQEAIQHQKDQKDNENVGVNEQGQVENNIEEIDEQDMEQSGDDLNQEAENEDNQSSIDEQGEDKGEGKKSDNNEKNASASSKHDQSSNEESQKESNQ